MYKIYLTSDNKGVIISNNKNVKGLIQITIDELKDMSFYFVYVSEAYNVK